MVLLSKPRREKVFSNAVNTLFLVASSSLRNVISSTPKVLEFSSTCFKALASLHAKCKRSPGLLYLLIPTTVARNKLLMATPSLREVETGKARIPVILNGQHLTIYDRIGLKS